MSALFFLSKVKEHKRALTVIMILSIIFPLIVLSIVAVNGARIAGVRTQRHAEHGAILLRREAVIESNPALRRYTANSPDNPQDTQKAEMLKVADGPVILDQKTVEAIQKHVWVNFEPELERQLKIRLDSMREPTMCE